MYKAKTDLKMKLLTERHEEDMKKIALETKLLLEDSFKKSQMRDLKMEILKKKLQKYN